MVHPETARLNQDISVTGVGPDNGRPAIKPRA